jgi:hypothetical protein
MMSKKNAPIGTANPDMELSSKTDEEILLYLQKDFEGRYDTVRDILWSRYALLIERRIQAVLDYHGIAYHPGQECYNRIYFHILERVWEINGFRSSLLKFNPERGKFKNWLLSFQVVNTVRDWLKCRETDERQSRLETISSRKNKETMMEHGVENFPDSAPTSIASPAPGMQSMESLEIAEQALVSLLYLAYAIPGKAVLEHLAGLHERSAESIEGELTKRRGELREMDRFGQGESILELMDVANERAQWFEYLMNEAKGDYFRCGGTWEELEHSERRSAGMKLGELDREVRMLERNRSDLAKTSRAKYAVFYRRHMKWSLKLNHLRERYYSGKFLITLSFRELSELLKKPEKTLRNQLLRFKKKWHEGK